MARDCPTNGGQVTSPERDDTDVAEVAVTSTVVVAVIGLEGTVEVGVVVPAFPVAGHWRQRQ